MDYTFDSSAFEITESFRGDLGEMFVEGIYQLPDPQDARLRQGGGNFGWALQPGPFRPQQAATSPRAPCPLARAAVWSPRPTTDPGDGAPPHRSPLVLAGIPALSSYMIPLGASVRASILKGGTCSRGYGYGGMLHPRRMTLRPLSAEAPTALHASCRLLREQQFE